MISCLDNIVAIITSDLKVPGCSSIHTYPVYACICIDHVSVPVSMYWKVNKTLSLLAYPQVNEFELGLGSGAL